jgi:hypothetical protein
MSRFNDHSRVVYFTSTNGDLYVPGILTANTDVNVGGTLTANTIVGASFVLGPNVAFSTVTASTLNVGSIVVPVMSSIQTFTSSIQSFNINTSSINSQRIFTNYIQAGGLLTSLSGQYMFTNTYSFTGASQSFTVPAGITTLQITMNGASGGGANSGPGAVITGTLSVTPGQVLQLIVGGRGTTTAGGYGGGGAPGDTSCGGGGGYSAIWDGTSVYYAIAGGGGGQGNSISISRIGGAGGADGVNGGSGEASGGRGGSTTLSSGGAGGTGTVLGQSGGIRQGGNGAVGTPPGSFGGGPAPAQPPRTISSCLARARPLLGPRPGLAWPAQIQ